MNLGIQRIGLFLFAYSISPVSNYTKKIHCVCLLNTLNESRQFPSVPWYSMSLILWKTSAIVLHTKYFARRESAFYVQHWISFLTNFWHQQWQEVARLYNFQVIFVTFLLRLVIKLGTHFALIRLVASSSLQFHSQIFRFLESACRLVIYTDFLIEIRTLINNTNNVRCTFDCNVGACWN